MSIKNFVLKAGRGIIDFSAVLWLIFLWFIGVALFQSENIALGIAIFIILFVIFIMSYFTLYLLISINDNLKEINEKINYNERDNSYEEN